MEWNCLPTWTVTFSASHLWWQLWFGKPHSPIHVCGSTLKSLWTWVTINAPVQHPPAPAPEHMEVDSFHISPTERQSKNICRAERHFMSEFPVRPLRPAVSNINVHPSVTSLLHIPVSVMSAHHYVSAKALIDSGSAGNFISRNLIDHF